MDKRSRQGRTREVGLLMPRIRFIRKSVGSAAVRVKARGDVSGQLLLDFSASANSMYAFTMQDPF
jgi:hypothetical protein